MNKLVLDRILKVIKPNNPKRSYIKIVECKSLYIVSIADGMEPILFTKEGLVTPVNFVELKKEQLKNAKLVYEL